MTRCGSNTKQTKASRLSIVMCFAEPAVVLKGKTTQTTADAVSGSGLDLPELSSEQ
jgi:hypothetical protein